MLGLTSLLRLFLRPFALWTTFICGSLTFVTWVVVFLVRGGRHSAVGATAEQIVHNAALHLAIGTVVVPMAVGSAIGWQLYELFLCPFAAHLPALRRRMVQALLLLGVVTAALTAWWCDENPGAQSAPLFLALCFPCFSLGVMWADPRFQALGKWGYPLQVVALAPVLLAPEYVALGERWPWLVGPLALIAGVGILCVPFTRWALRARLDAVDKLPALRSTGFGSPDFQVVTPTARVRARWRPGRTLKGPADWTRAALYEGFGHVPGGWLGAALLYAVVWSTVLMLIGFVMGFGSERDWQAAARYVYSMLAGDVPAVRHVAPIPAAAMPIWTAMFLVSTPFALHGAGGYPVSRAARGEVAWRASTTLVGTFLIALTVVLAAYMELAFRLSGLTERVREFPAFLHTVTGVAVVAPLAQAVRMRWVGRRLAPANPLAVGSLIGLVGVLLGAPGVAIAILFTKALPQDTALPWLALTVALVAFSQGLWRQHLRRHYLVGDLAV